MAGLSWKARWILQEFEAAGSRPGEGLAAEAFHTPARHGRNVTADGIDELRRDGLVSMVRPGRMALTDAGYDAIQAGGADGE